MELYETWFIFDVFFVVFVCSCGFCLSIFYSIKNVFFLLSCEHNEMHFSIVNRSQLRRKKKRATSLNSTHFNVNAHIPFAWWQTPAILSHFYDNKTRQIKWEGTECVLSVFPNKKLKLKRRCKQNAWWRLLLHCLSPILLFVWLFYDAVFFRSFHIMKFIFMKKKCI